MSLGRVSCPLTRVFPHDLSVNEDIGKTFWFGCVTRLKNGALAISGKGGEGERRGKHLNEGKPVLFYEEFAKKEVETIDTPQI